MHDGHGHQRDARATAGPWAEVAGIALAADEVGAYAIYVCDHFMGHTDNDAVTDEGMLESMTLLAALAR